MSTFRFRTAESKDGAAIRSLVFSVLQEYGLEEEAEIRKMYFRPQVRGQGLGRALLSELITTAKERGFQRVVLETASVLTDAIALYVKFGFRPVDRCHQASRCDQAYALELGDGDPSAG